MSIIHEALKKAERDREPRPKGLPLFGGGRTARRRWRPARATGMLIGLTTVGAGSIWLWTYSPMEGPLGQYRRTDGAELASHGAGGGGSNRAADAHRPPTANPASASPGRRHCPQTTSHHPAPPPHWRWRHRSQPRQRLNGRERLNPKVNGKKPGLLPSGSHTQPNPGGGAE